ncbi:unnamed protein product [Hymenolepis diminuta]|uniref:Uncharacterized protein n=1 Tax=Hymenolepis diminuta TaxID=6216 RepID=A0A564Y5E2_HYMDI|nr:unnamed protein product [Hymenolepis diminuta]
MSRRTHRFPLFSNNGLVSHKKHICAHALARPYPSDSYKAIFVFHTRTTHACSCQFLRFLFISSLPQRAPLSISRFKLVVASLNTLLWPNQLLVFRFTIVVSLYPNSYGVVTVTAVVILIPTIVSHFYGQENLKNKT